MSSDIRMCSPKIFILHGYPRSTFHKSCENSLLYTCWSTYSAFKLAQVTYQSKIPPQMRWYFVYEELANCLFRYAGSKTKNIAINSVNNAIGMECVKT